MTARQRYCDELSALADDEVVTYLTDHSGLPGPRSNLELLYAFGDVAPASLVVRLADDDDEYLRCCGTAALGRLLLAAADERAAGSQDATEVPGGGGARGEGDSRMPDSGDRTWFEATLTDRTRLEETLTDRARDPMWRVREGAAMAGQRIGAASPQMLAALVGRWLDTGEPLVARAAVAAVCEPPILRPSPLLRACALDACARATDVLRAVPVDRRRNADVRTLRQGLAYCWSVAVAQDPDAGLSRFLALADDPDADVAWVYRENRKKHRLVPLLVSAQ